MAAASQGLSLWDPGVTGGSTDQTGGVLLPGRLDTPDLDLPANTERTKPKSSIVMSGGAPLPTVSVILPSPSSSKSAATMASWTLSAPSDYPSVSSLPAPSLTRETSYSWLSPSSRTSRTTTTIRSRLSSYSSDLTLDTASRTSVTGYHISTSLISTSALIPSNAFPTTDDPWISSPFTSLLSEEVPLSSSVEEADSSIQTIEGAPRPLSTSILVSFSFTTKYWTTTISGGGVATLSSIIATGVLSTDGADRRDSFSQNTGAIIGVTVAATVALLAIVIGIFFACKRYTRRFRENDDNTDVLRGDFWTPPLDGTDDVSEHFSTGEIVHPSDQSFVGTHTHTDETNEASTTLDHPTTESFVLPHHLSPQASMSQMSPFPGLSPQVYMNVVCGFGPNVPAILGPDSPFPVVSPPRAVEHVVAPSTRKNMAAASIVSVDTASSHTHDRGSSAHDHLLGRKRSECRVSHSGKRISFPPFVRSKPPSLEGVLSKLRSRSPNITAEVANARAAEEGATAGTPRPIIRTPSKTLQRHVPMTPEPLWPPATLPPSPTPTDHSRVFEGLLTPYLGTQPDSSQSSSTSLRDHIDYSRPIGGLVRNHVHSTTTFTTADTGRNPGFEHSN